MDGAARNLLTKFITWTLTEYLTSGRSTGALRNRDIQYFLNQIIHASIKSNLFCVRSRMLLFLILLAVKSVFRVLIRRNSVGHSWAITMVWLIIKLSVNMYMGDNLPKHGRRRGLWHVDSHSQAAWSLVEEALWSTASSKVTWICHEARAKVI